MLSADDDSSHLHRAFLMVREKRPLCDIASVKMLQEKTIETDNAARTKVEVRESK